MRVNGTSDIDGNGVIEARTDGLLLILRALPGFTGTAATNGALGTAPTRNN